MNTRKILSQGLNAAMIMGAPHADIVALDIAIVKLRRRALARHDWSNALALAKYWTTKRRKQKK